MSRCAAASLASSTSCCSCRRSTMTIAVFGKWTVGFLPDVWLDGDVRRSHWPVPLANITETLMNNCQLGRPSPVALFQMLKVKARRCTQMPPASSSSSSNWHRAKACLQSNESPAPKAPPSPHLRPLLRLSAHLNQPAAAQRWIALLIGLLLAVCLACKQKQEHLCC